MLGGGLAFYQLSGNFSNFDLSTSQTISYSFTSTVLGVGVQAMLKADLSDLFYIYGTVTGSLGLYGFGDATLNGATVSYDGDVDATQVGLNVGIGLNTFRDSERMGRP